MKKYFVLLILIFHSSTFAGMIMEPLLGYSLLKGGDYTGQGDAKYSFSALTFAIRIGFLHESGIGGGFYTGTSLAGTFSRDDNTVDFDFDATRNDLGPYLTYQYGEIPIRGFFQYFLASSLEVTDDQATTVGGIGYDGRKFRGNGFSLGAGFTGLPNAAVNLEYRHYTYDESAQYGVTDTSKELSLSELLLSISFPYHFF